VDIKGFTHTDFVVSLAIFILYLSFLFVFIKPITIQADDGGLVDIVKGGIDKDLRWTVTKTPMIINCKSCEGSIARGIEPFCLRSPFVDWKKFCFTDLSLATIGADPHYSQSAGEGDPDAYNCDNGFAFDANLRNGGNAFWLWHSDEESLLTCSLLGFSCDYKKPDSDICQFLEEDTDYTYNYGTTEFLNGLSKEKFNNLTNIDYNDLKKSWGFSRNKDFVIYVYDLNYKELMSYSIKNPTGEVFASQWPDSIVEGDGTKIPVLINIRVW